MNSLEKAFIFYCVSVSFFCIVLLACVLKLNNDIKTLNKNQITLEENIEEVDSFNVKMWDKQIEIDKKLLGIEYETY